MGNILSCNTKIKHKRKTVATDTYNSKLRYSKVLEPNKMLRPLHDSKDRSARGQGKKEGYDRI